MDRATVPKPMADRLGGCLGSSCCFWELEEEDVAGVSVAGEVDEERSAAWYNANRGRGAGLERRRAVKGVRRPPGVSRAMVKERHWAVPGLNGSLVLGKRGLK